jgi:hypothetical protein
MISIRTDKNIRCLAKRSIGLYASAQHDAAMRIDARKRSSRDRKRRSQEGHPHEYREGNEKFRNDECRFLLFVLDCGMEVVPNRRFARLSWVSVSRAVVVGDERVEEGRSQKRHDAKER